MKPEALFNLHIDPLPAQLLHGLPLAALPEPPAPAAAGVETLLPADAEQISDLAALGRLRLEFSSATASIRTRCQGLRADRIGDWVRLTAHRTAAWLRPPALHSGHITRLTGVTGWRRRLDYLDPLGRPLLGLDLDDCDREALEAFRTVYTAHGARPVRRGPPGRSITAVQPALLKLVEHPGEPAPDALQARPASASGLRVLVQIAEELDLALTVSHGNSAGLLQWSGYLTAPRVGEQRWRGIGREQFEFSIDESRISQAWIIETADTGRAMLAADRQLRSFVCVQRAQLPGHTEMGWQFDAQWPSLMSYLESRA